MNPKGIETFLAEDYQKAIKFYDDRSCSSKKEFRALSIYIICASAILTPLVALIPDTLTWKIIASFLSATLVVATGLLAHFKSQENWISYRSAWDALEREKRFFVTETGPYKNEDDKASKFIERIEEIRAGEGLGYFNRHAKTKTTNDNSKS